MKSLSSVAFLTVCSATMLLSGAAGAQIGLAGAPPSAPQGPPPETHAASGAEDALTAVTGGEPRLPADPLAIPDEVADRIGSDAGHDREKGRGPTVDRDWYGLYYAERSGDFSFKTLFPLWFERRQPNDRASFFSPLYFNRRSKDHDADVVFPLFWKLRDGDTHTTVVGPVARRTTPTESDTWVAPFYFGGSRPGGGYTVIPPLLTYTKHDADSGFNLVGPAYCSWKGGSSCNLRTAEDIDFGIAPFYFAGKSDRSRYELAPPLLHYFHYDELTESSINVWGPLVWKRGKERQAFNVFPFFWHLWGANEDHVTLFPLFHHGYKGNARLHVNPLFLTARSEEGADTFVTWGYARYRGRTQLDMITPFYWRWEDPDIGRESRLVFPFLYASRGPRSEDTAFFPFWAHFKRHGLSETTWVTPFFQHTHSLTGFQTNIHPILYVGRTYDETHTVVAPFFWDFASPESRATVAFPVYWRFADRDSVSQVLLNTYYREKRRPSGSDWEFHLFPALSFGATPQGHWWNVLYGLAGYTREGTATKVRAMWIPISLSE